MPRRPRRRRRGRGAPRGRVCRVCAPPAGKRAGCVGGEPVEEAVRMGKIIRRMGVTSLVIDTDRMMMGPAALRASMEATEKAKKTRGIFSGGPAETAAGPRAAKYLSLAEVSDAAVLAAAGAGASSG